MSSSSSSTLDLNLKTLSDILESEVERLIGAIGIIERHKKRLERLLDLVDTLRLKEKTK